MDKIDGKGKKLRVLASMQSTHVLDVLGALVGIA
jgi:hypothetical protein